MLVNFFCVQVTKICVTFPLTRCNGQSSWLNSIKFDQFDAMTISCDIGQLYLYNTTGSYLNKNIPAVSSAYNIGFDSKSRFVVVTWIKITIYN